MRPGDSAGRSRCWLAASRSGRGRRRSAPRGASASRPLEQIRGVPKVLRHDHLAGGLRRATIVELAADTGYRDLPTSEPIELGAWMNNAAERGQLELYLEAFRHTVGVMQTRDAL